jgi:hypothetical protein
MDRATGHYEFNLVSEEMEMSDTAETAAPARRQTPFPRQDDKSENLPIAWPLTMEEVES